MTCLAGKTEKQMKERDEVLAVLEATDYTYYVILLKGSLGRQDYQALYSHDGAGQVEKLCGSGPETLGKDMVEKFYKYNLGAKVFEAFSGKDFTPTTDAVALQQQFTKKNSATYY